MANRKEPKSARIVYAERMIAIAEFMRDPAMTGDDIKRAYDALIEMYEATKPELPALAGYDIQRLEALSLTLDNLDIEIKAAKKRMQKWK